METRTIKYVAVMEFGDNLVGSAPSAAQVQQAIEDGCTQDGIEQPASINVFSPSN
jgi:hypothetical protein